MKKILLTGKDGQVGKELEKYLQPLGKVIAFGRVDFNLQDPNMLRKVIRELKPDLIVNAAAYTAVDKAETDQETAFIVNTRAPEILAEEARVLGASLVHYSTDYVFDGISTNKTCLKPFCEDDTPNPLNVYGKTKLEGERAILATKANHLIFRTSWVYGLRGKNFLLTMLRLAKEKEQLSVVSDQLGAPTWSVSIAKTTAEILKHCIERNNFSDLSGTYHLTSSGMTSWHGFAEEIFNQYKVYDSSIKIPILNRILTSEYPLPAVRPAYSVLSNNKIENVFKVKMPDWKEALKECLSN